MDVSYKNQSKKLGLLVVAGNGPSLLGRDWLSQLQLDLSQINRVLALTASDCEEIQDEYKTVLKNELGKVEGMTAKFHNYKPGGTAKVFQGSTHTLCPSS